MKINSSYHNEILEDFEKRHPDWAKDIVSCVPKHTHAIRITFSNGVQIDYNIRTRTYREVQEYFYTTPNDITDDDCRKIFSKNLCEVMKMKGFGQPELAERTGLSTAMISKYMRGLATPSITNLEKITYALNCSRDELLDWYLERRVYGK